MYTLSLVNWSWCVTFTFHMTFYINWKATEGYIVTLCFFFRCSFINIRSCYITLVLSSSDPFFLPCSNSSDIPALCICFTPSFPSTHCVFTVITLHSILRHSSYHPDPVVPSSPSLSNGLYECASVLVLSIFQQRQLVQVIRRPLQPPPWAVQPSASASNPFISRFLSFSVCGLLLLCFSLNFIALALYSRLLALFSPLCTLKMKRALDSNYQLIQPHSWGNISAWILYYIYMHHQQTVSLFVSAQFNRHKHCVKHLNVVFPPTETKN